MIRALFIVSAALVLLAALSPAARAQSDVGVSARASSTTAWVGDTIRYTISVESDSEPQRPQVEALGFDVQEGGQSRRESLQIINGRRQQSITTDFHYHLRPLREGALEIPPVSVGVGQQTYRTQSVWIEARRPQQTEDLRATIEPERASPYVGEPVRVSITFYFAAEKRVRDLWPSIAMDESRARLDAASALPARIRGGGRRQVVDLEVNGRQVQALLDEAQLDGRRFGAVTFDMLVTPLEAGPLELGPVTIALDEIVGQERPGFFDSPFRDRTQTQRVVIASDPVTLDVRALPSAGRPADFTGLVGRYDLSVTADRERASVGDPIGLSLRIRGPEPMSGAGPPSLQAPHITSDFRTDSEGWRPEGATTGERRYSTTVRARSAEVTAFPPLELPYFDPEAGQYRIARSQPALLKIAPTEIVTAANAEFGPLQARPTLREKLGAGPSGLLANPAPSEALVKRAPALALGQMAPVLGVALALPPALCAAVLMARVRRQRRQGPSRRAGLRAARRRLRTASDDPAAAAGALQAWLGAALDIEPGAVTATDAEQAIRPDDRDLAERVAVFLRDCDAARYQPGAVADRSLRSRAQSLLREMVREGLPR